LTQRACAPTFLFAVEKLMSSIPDNAPARRRPGTLLAGGPSRRLENRRETGVSP
jgi:hypothetical protein